MAERHQLKIADHDGIAADDPFAELTRIMGFDPREPVSPQAAASRQPGPDEAPAQDFDIDLEKELMGEFSAYDDPAQAASEHEPETVVMRQPAQRPEEEHAVSDAEMDDALAASFERDFAASSESEPEAPQDELEIPAIEPEAYADQQDGYADPQDAAAERHAAPEEAGDAEVAAALQGTWFAPVEGEDGEAEAVALEHSDLVAAQSHDDEEALDAAVFADLDDELAASDHVVAAPEENPAYAETSEYEHVASVEEAAPYEEVVSYQEAAPYQEPLDNEQPEPRQAYEGSLEVPTVDADGFDTHFDSAMADVDMDFDARPQAESAGFVPAEEAISHDHAVSDADLDIQSALDEAFDESLAEPAVAVPVEPVAAAPVETVVTQGENTLEDELNALLAKMTTRPAVASAWPVTTPVVRPPESAPAASQTPQATAPEPAIEPTISAEASEDDLHAALMADLDAMDLDEVPETGEEIDFDADAFHAAFTEADEATPAQEPVHNWSVPAPAASQPVAPPNQPAPDVETVDVPERVVALADDLEIPEVPFEEPSAENNLYGDLENEFAGLLGQMDAAPAQVHAAYDDDAYGTGFRRGAMQPQAGAFQQPVAPVSAAAFHPAAAGLDADNMPGGAPSGGSDPFAVDELAYDPDDTAAISGLADAQTARPQRRGLLIAGIVCAVAVAGGLGAMALSFGGSSGEEAPALVKTDNGPIKVKPENPGGAVIPNQDNKVYEAVAKGIQPAAPEQKNLVTSNEEPLDVNTAVPQSRVVDLAEPDDATSAGAGAPGAKSEDRLEETAQNTDAAAPDAPVVTPRKVRTMVVKPDGSLVPREDPAPKVAAAEPADPEPQHVVATGDQTGAVPPAKATEEPALKPAGASASTPKTAPIAPPRPSEQPVDVVGEVKADKVASIDTTASTAGSWSMQIASQPTAESAQSTYQSLARRYAGVLGGHDVNIVKADIAGKGTFYRVRVPTGSRNDAITLCESYKAAGGNCFVSK